MTAAQFQTRREDGRLLTGGGHYAADRAPEGCLAVAFVRSPHGHAQIAGIDAGAALESPGVVGVLTGADAIEAGMSGLPGPPALRDADGNPPVVPLWPALPEDRAVHIGQAVALVAAGSEAQAHDAAELIEVDWRERPAVADASAALASDAPPVWPDAPGNAAIVWTLGDSVAAADVFDRAAHVTRIRLESQRIAVMPMEPRAASAEYDPETGRYTLWAGSQGVSGMRRGLAKVMNVPADQIRVVSRDVGGGFGMKTPAYPEYAALLLAARRFGRPVKWVADRSEAFQSDSQGRDSVMEAELALDGDGRFLALRAKTVANVGAFLTPAGAFISSEIFSRSLPGPYVIPVLDLTVTCAFTNTVPIGPYRGAGRPEAAYLLERIVEQAARETGVDAVELRRRNMVPADAMPWENGTGSKYDSGDFAGVMDAALALADRDGFEARRKAARDAGLLRGLGIGCYLELAGGQPQEWARVRFRGDGVITINAGTQTNGQGHETVLPAVFADRLGVPAESVQLGPGDTDVLGNGGGTVGSRSLVAGGGALICVAEAVIEKGKTLASERLEAAAEDIEYDRGVFRIAGTDREVALQELAAPDDSGDSPLDTESRIDSVRSYPNGCHVAEVEIDPEAGTVSVVAYYAVNDFGTVINPTIVAGQIHGGVAQGIGQALMEHVVYDADSGQLVTGSFMDYAMPRADNLPFLELGFRPTPCTTNALGAKGCGEAGTTAALPAVMNAVIDALSPLGIHHLDMPATPERVWRAIRSAKAG